MGTLTFIIDDKSTSSTNPTVQVTITENSDGSLTFVITQIVDSVGDYVGDLRGFFFDIANEGLIGSLSATGAGITEVQTGNDSVSNLGDGVNMQGLLGTVTGSEGTGYDVGIEIGTSGLGKDDYRTSSFTLSSSSRPLSLDDFANMDFGIRITSVGQVINYNPATGTYTLGARTGSAKIVEAIFDPVHAVNDSADVLEDACTIGNLLTNDGLGAGGTVLTSITSGATSIPFSGADPIILTLPSGTEVTIWSNGAYKVDASNADPLAAGQIESVAIGYTVLQTVSGDGGTVTGQANFTIHITGTNDAPTISVADGSGAVTEDASDPILTDSGTISFDDVDLIDTHSVSVSKDSGTLGGSLAAVVSDPASGAGAGTVSWTYTVANSATQYLALGETTTESFTVTIDDGHGGSIDQAITVTVTGTNDAPTIDLVTTDAAAITLTEANVPLLASGTLTVSDADTSGTVSSSVTSVSASGNAGVLTNAQLLAMLSVAPGSGLAADEGNTHNLAWTFSSGSEAFNYLPVGQSLTLAYTVQSSDGIASDTQTVTVTINGTNDVPVIGGQTSGAVTEDNVTSTSGTLTINDPDSGQSSFLAQSGLAGTYGTLNINATGNWTYFLNNSLAAVQALNAGQTLNDTVTVQTADGTTQSIGITINGQNEASGFVGKQLTYQYVFPNSGTDYQSSLAFTTGGGVEVPQSFSPYYAGYFNVDVSNTSILITFTNNVTWATANVNGFKLTDVVDNVYNITGVSDNSIKATTTSNTNTISVNWQGQSFAAGETILINVTFSNNGHDPIILDLNGDGVKFATGEHAVNFDLDASGGAELISWAAAEDGILAIDLDGSGAIENGNEVLSENFAGFGFGTSMEALRSLDTNLDGTVDATDAQFAQLLVWQDINTDGISQTGELKSLADLGIAGISVQEEIRNETVDGQFVFAAGTFTYVGGGTGEYVGVQLSAPEVPGTTSSTNGALISGHPASLVGDTFVFASPEDAAQTIVDFNPGSDTFQISAAGFGGGLLAGGAITLVQGETVTASGTDGQFLFDTGAQKLYWDVDGIGTDSAVLIAALANVNSLSTSDFLVV